MNKAKFFAESKGKNSSTKCPPPVTICLIIKVLRYLKPFSNVITLSEVLDNTGSEVERACFLALKQILAQLASGSNDPINIYPFLGKLCVVMNTNLNEFECLDVSYVWDSVIKVITDVVPPLREVFLGRVSAASVVPSCFRAQFVHPFQTLEEVLHSTLLNYAKEPNDVHDIHAFTSAVLSHAPEILMFAVESSHSPLTSTAKTNSKTQSPTAIRFPESFDLSLLGSEKESHKTTFFGMGRKSPNKDKLASGPQWYDLTTVVSLQGERYDAVQAYYRNLDAKHSPQWMEDWGAHREREVPRAKAVEGSYFSSSNPTKVHPRLLIYIKRDGGEVLNRLSAEAIRSHKALQKHSKSQDSDEEKENGSSSDEDEADENEESSDDSSEEESSDDDEEDEDEDEEESSDDEDSSSDDSTSSSDDNDSDADDKVEIKVHVLPGGDIRGFAVHLTDSGLHIIHKALKKDYGAVINLFFRDSDGDAVSIKSAHDLKYASRSSKTQANGATASNHTTLKLKLFAETGASSAAGAPVVKTESGSVHGTSDTTVRFEPMHQVLSLDLESSSQTLAEHDAGSRSGSNSARGSARGSARSSARAPHVTVPILTEHLSTSHGELELGVSQDMLQSPVKSSALNYEVMWKKGELLGSGSFGKVYSGMNLSSGERIAVKEVVLRRGKKHRQQAQALQLEVKILSSLDHPNIIKYLGTEYTKQTLRIFLELANDGTIKDALNEFGAFPEPLVRRYTADILEGLWFLHSKKFIHRDIKPTNLLVSGGRVKLGDFGCSTSIVEDDTAADGFHNTVAGTAVYMAPEVMQAGNDLDLAAASQQHHQQQHHVNDKPVLSPRAAATDTQSRTIQRVAPAPVQAPILPHTGLKRVDSRAAQELGSVLVQRRKGYGKRADIWSVGITLLEMASGRAPFPNAGAAIYAVCVSKQYPSFPDQFSSDAHSFLARCLVEDPKVRATSAELRLMPFMNVQSADEMRAQTAAMPRTAHTLSNVTVHLPEDFSFLQSPRGAEDGERESREGRMGAGTCREESKMASFTEEDWFRTAVTSHMTSHVNDGEAAHGKGKAAQKISQRRPQQGEFTDTDSGSIAQRKLWSRTAGMDPLGVESKAQTEFNDSDSEENEDLLRSTSSRRFYSVRNNVSAGSVSQDEEMFQRGVQVSRAAAPSIAGEMSALSKEVKRRGHKDYKSEDFHSAKECSEDEDCKTGYSTLFS